MPVVLSSALEQVVAAVATLRTDDALITSSERLLGEIDTVFEVITMLQAVAVRRLGEARAIDATTAVAGRSTKRWLIEEALLPATEAGRWMRFAHLLPHHPALQSAFDTGQINAAHVSAILTALASLPAGIRDTVEPHLIERARFYPPEEIAGFVDELLDALGLDNTADARRERRNAQRGVDLARTLDGVRSMTGTLTPEVGDHLEQALALAEANGGLEDTRTPRQRQHDALGAIAESYLAHHGAPPSFDGAPRSMIITMDLELLEDRLRQQWITLPDGATISADTARRLACDAQLIPIVLGGASEPLDIGQADHDFTCAIRRAAYERDGGRCAFPDCANPVAHLHHIIFRSHQGPTSSINAAWVCTYHHWLAHEGRWTLSRLTDGNYLWTGPYGQQRVRRLSPRTGPPPRREVDPPRHRQTA